MIRNANLVFHRAVCQAFSKRIFWREPRMPHVDGFDGDLPDCFSSVPRGDFKAKPVWPCEDHRADRWASELRAREWAR
jgi:hypothetical protein